MSSLMNVLNLGECSNFIKAFPIILLCFRWSGPSRSSGYKLQWLTVEDMTVYVGFHSDKIQETMILKYGLDGLILRKNVYPFFKLQMPNGNQVALPVPGGYNPMKASEKGKKAGSPGQTCLDLGRIF